jgi:hypothetical protein
LCGADDWFSIELFGKAKEAWFTKVLGLEHGIPSPDTFGNVFEVINTQEFTICFCRWASDLADLSGIGIYTSICSFSFEGEGVKSTSIPLY